MPAQTLEERWKASKVKYVPSKALSTLTGKPIGYDVIVNDVNVGMVEKRRLAKSDFWMAVIPENDAFTYITTKHTRKESAYALFVESSPENRRAREQARAKTLADIRESWKNG